MSVTPSIVPYSRQVKLNYPNKVLEGSASLITGVDYWPYQNGASDPWYEGAISKRFYKWQVQIAVQPQLHGSHLTRDDFQYNGLDIIVGDWIAGATDGKCLRITEIQQKTKTSITCVVEDYLRYNTFKNANGNGMFSGGAVVIFTLNEEGFPILDPMPTSTSADFFTIVASRFQYLNPQTNYVLDEPNNGFAKGDVISVVSTGYVKANAETADSMVGVVTEAGPGPDKFMILPNNRIYDFDPGVPGRQGEYIYVDDNGELSNVSATTKKAIFLNIRDSIPTVLGGTQPGPTVPNSYNLAINDEDITFTSANATVNVFEIAEQINIGTANHYVVATVETFPTTLESNALNAFYGLVGGYVPFSATFNTGGTTQLVNFTTSGSIYPGVASAIDMKADIDAANIPNLTVTATENDLFLNELNGNTVIITNTTNDANNIPFAGTVSVTGFDTTYTSINADKLVLTRPDGGEVLIYEDSDAFQTATGIFSGHTGALPLAMNIEQGVRTGGIYVVSTVAQRDGLAPIAGDQAYVINKGDGEWGLYCYTGSSWVQVSDQDSANTDARTLTTAFTLPIAEGDFSTQTLGNVSAGRKITEVSISVDDALVGFTQDPLLTIGTTADPEQFLNGNGSDLTAAGSYLVYPEYVYPATSIQDITLTATLQHYRANTGNVTIKVTYV